jgi:hypothetical protein
MQPGHAKQQDYEYGRNGTGNLFLALEPLRGWRRIQVTARRTALDFAEQLRLLVDEVYPDAETVVLVTDNLNTHSTACLYDRFPPDQARRIARKLEWHYTPEHGSWLNMAECELSVLSRQCLKRRIGSTGGTRAGSVSLARAAQCRQRHRRLALHHRRRPHQTQASVSVLRSDTCNLTKH